MDASVTYSLQVSSKELSQALRQIARFKKTGGKREMMMVSFDGEALTFSMADVSVGVSAQGTWPGDVIVPALSIYGIAKVPFKSAEVTITLESTRLKIGTSVMSVTWGAIPSALTP